MLLDEENDVDDSRRVCCATSPPRDGGSGCEWYSLLADVKLLAMSSGYCDARA